MTISGLAAEPAEPERLSFLTRCVGTGFFSGHIPGAPGTYGSLVGVLIYLIPGVESTTILIPLIILGFFAGVVTSGKIARVEGNRLSRAAALAKATFQAESTHGPDPSIVVIDEIVGMWIALAWLPKEWLMIVFAFAAFRIMDILKPQPAREVERIPRGWGIMLDDVVAGVYANIAVRLVLLALSQFLPFVRQGG